jgi:hypothetical protein
MKKILKFRPELVTKTFIGEKCLQDPKKINKGFCMQWAFIAYYMFEGVELWHIACHAFVKYKDKFYDSECLDGVLDWRDLPACNWGRGCGCSLCEDGASKQSEKVFKNFWNKNPIKPNWNLYIKTAVNVIEEYENE